MNDKNSKYDRRRPVPDRRDQRSEVVYSTDENRSDENPDQSRQPTERQPGQDRSHDRARRGNCGEVLRHQRTGRKRLEIDAILQFVGGRRTFGIESEQSGQQAAVGEVSDRQHNGRREHDIQQIHDRSGKVGQRVTTTARERVTRKHTSARLDHATPTHFGARG
jgi:hypothetical protein